MASSFDGTWVWEIVPVISAFWMRFVVFDGSDLWDYGDQPRDHLGRNVAFGADALGKGKRFGRPRNRMV